MRFFTLPASKNLFPSPDIMLPESSQIKNLNGTFTRFLINASCNPGGHFKEDKYSRAPASSITFWLEIFCSSTLFEKKNGTAVGGWSIGYAEAVG
jgi:hypothetical protein